PSIGRPSLIIITVGRLRTPNCEAIMPCSSAFTLASKKSPAYSSANLSNSGIKDLHGPHQSAQKSTITGRLNDSSINWAWALASVMSTLKICTIALRYLDEKRRTVSPALAADESHTCTADCRRSSAYVGEIL